MSTEDTIGAPAETGLLDEPAAPEPVSRIREIPIKDIRDSDPRVKVRHGEPDRATVKRYEEAFDRLPPVVIYEIEGVGLLLADGHHRLKAAANLGRAKIKAVVHQGTIDDAYEYAVKANSKSGQPLTASERDDAIITLAAKHKSALGWATGWTARRVAEVTGTSEDIVGKVLKATKTAEAIGARCVDPGTGKYSILSAPRGSDPDNRLPKKGASKSLTLSDLYEVSMVPEEFQKGLALKAQESKMPRDQIRKTAKVLNDSTAPDDAKAAAIALTETGNEPGKGNSATGSGDCKETGSAHNLLMLLEQVITLAPNFSTTESDAAKVRGYIDAINRCIAALSKISGTLASQLDGATNDPSAQQAFETAAAINSNLEPSEPAQQQTTADDKPHNNEEGAVAVDPAPTPIKEPNYDEYTFGPARGL